jgi:hypothetical protein
VAHRTTQRQPWICARVTRDCQLPAGSKLAAITSLHSPESRKWFIIQTPYAGRVTFGRLRDIIDQLGAMSDTNYTVIIEKQGEIDSD